MNSHETSNYERSIYNIKESINQAAIRYAYNSIVSSYIGPFDYMMLQCDGVNLNYSLHTKHASQDSIQIILPLKLIKPIYEVLLPYAEDIEDPLSMNIDDNLAVFLYYVSELYDTGKLLGTHIEGTQAVHIHALATSHISLPLTHPQKRIWAIERIYNEEKTGMHNLGLLIHIDGVVQFDILQTAIQTVLSQHDGIRLQFTEQGAQYVAEYEQEALPFVDYSSKSYEEALGLLEDSVQLYMPIVDSPLYAITLVRFTNQQSGYMIKTHHAISDGWSIQLITDQIRDLYTALSTNQPYEFKVQSYLDYMKKEQSYLESKRAQQDKQFWLEMFAELPARLRQHSIQQVQTRGRREVYTVDRTITRQLNQLLQADGTKASTNSFFITVFFLYEWMTTGRTDIIVGTPVLNRSGAKEKSMFGMFTSTMPFRYAIPDDISFIKMLHTLSSKLMQCYFHQRYPYDMLIKELRSSHEFLSDLFSISVNYYNTKLAPQFDRYSVNNVELYSGHQFFPLNIIIKEWTELQVAYDYRLDMYTSAEVSTLHNNIVTIMKLCLRHPQISIHELREHMERI